MENVTLNLNPIFHLKKRNWIFIIMVVFTLNCIIVKNVLGVSNRIYYLLNITLPKNWCEVVWKVNTLYQR